MKRIAILAHDGCLASSVTGPMDVFAVANVISRDLKGSRRKPPFEVEVVTPSGREATPFTGTGIRPNWSTRLIPPVDIIFLPASYGCLDQTLATSDIMEWIRKAHRFGSCVCAVCAGVFLLAESGVLKDRPATTHWQLADTFRKRYPEIPLKPERMLIDGGDYVCAGGVTAYLDLALHITARFSSPEIASLTAKTLLIDPIRRSQTPYEVFMQNKGHGDAEVLVAQEWIETNLASEITMEKVAEAANLGLRTLLRRFKKATGETPLTYVQNVRIETAKRMLETTNMGMDAITEKAGYEDPSSFRKLFKTRTGLTPGQYRQRFSLVG